MTYWRSTSQHEVDLLLDTKVAIEIKATENLSSKHFKGLRARGEERLMSRYICVYCGSLAGKTEDGIEMVHYRQFLDELWAGGIIQADIVIFCVA